MDGEKQWETSVKNHSDSVRRTTQVGTDDSLSAFFSRPITTPPVIWTPFSVTPLYFTFNPWTFFFQNARVSNRMTNFYLLNATLKVKVMINGNPFYYGRLMAEYAPLAVYDFVNDYSGLAPIANLTIASQRMHIYVDPTPSQGGILSLPFIWHRDNAGITEADLSNMGNLYLREINQLKHANAATTPIEITFAVWAEDVELSVPTTIPITGLVAQSNEKLITKDEYGQGSVSKIASGIASVSSKLMTFPVIAPYAKATSMVASGLGALASLFGFSRPVVLSDIAPMRPTFVGRMAVTDGGDTIQKLSVDSKQELSIDPRICGVDTGDELAISRLASIQSYLTQFPWTTANPAAAPLFNVRVTPAVCTLSSSYYYLPACAFVSRPFSYWRGTMRYRFQIVASAYHKGRLRIVYDPSYINSLESNISFTRIVDLDVERDVTIDVAYSQPNQYLPVGTIATSAGPTTYTNGGSYNVVNSTCNGVLGVYVLNTLTSPNSTVANDIAINVFVSMCEADCEFAVPNETDFNLVTSYAFTPQSAEVSLAPDDNAPNTEMPTDCMASCSPSDDRNAVYFGERITSFRQLLRRYTLHSVYNFLAVAADQQILDTVNNPDFPQYYGYSAANMHSTSTAGKFNYVQGSLLHYLTPAFLAVKGGIRSKYRASGSSGQGNQTLSIERGISSAYLPVTSLLYSAGTTTSQYAYNNLARQKPGFNGIAITPAERQPFLEVEHPYYRNIRFSQARDVTGSLTSLSPMADGHLVTLTSANTGNRYLTRYIAVAEDFTLFYFQGCPRLRVLSQPVA